MSEETFIATSFVSSNDWQESRVISGAEVLNLHRSGQTRFCQLQNVTHPTRLGMRPDIANNNGSAGCFDILDDLNANLFASNPLLTSARQRLEEIQNSFRFAHFPPSLAHSQPDMSLPATTLETSHNFSFPNFASILPNFPPPPDFPLGEIFPKNSDFFNNMTRSLNANYQGNIAHTRLFERLSNANNSNMINYSQSQGRRESCDHGCKSSEGNTRWVKWPSDSSFIHHTPTYYQDLEPHRQPSPVSSATGTISSTSSSSVPSFSDWQLGTKTPAFPLSTQHNNRR